MTTKSLHELYEEGYDITFITLPNGKRAAVVDTLARVFGIGPTPATLVDADGNRRIQ